MKYFSFRVFIKYCVLFKSLKIFRNPFSLGVSVCTHTRQVEHQRCSTTAGVQKNHNILRKNTIFNKHPVGFSKKKLGISRCSLLRFHRSCANYPAGEVPAVKVACVWPVNSMTDLWTPYYLWLEYLRVLAGMVGGGSWRAVGASGHPGPKLRMIGLVKKNKCYSKYNVLVLSMSIQFLSNNFWSPCETVVRSKMGMKSESRPFDRGGQCGRL